MSNKPTAKQLEKRIKWVEALRSGKYRQGTIYLVNLNEQGGARHCCLGVACDVPGMTVKKRGDLYCFSDDSSTSFLPKYTQRLLGLDEQGTLETKVEGHSTLWQLNDHAAYTFDQIADVIEKQFITPYLNSEVAVVNE